MFNVLCNIPSPTDATSWYRAVGPIAHMKKKYRNIQFNMVDRYNWASIQPSDVVFLQRPFKKDHLEIAHMAHRAKVPIWVDYDDYLLGVPTDNPTYFDYATEDVKKVITQICTMASAVTVSTPYLGNLLSKYCVKPPITIPNAINDYLYPRHKNPPQRQKLAVWRGSRTHQRDMMTVAEPLIALQNDPKNTDWMFCYIGDNMWFITDNTPHNRTIVSKPIFVDEYLEELSALKPSLVHVPLNDSPFNRAKSNIAWIEGTYAGAVVIAPDWEEWKHPGVLNYDSPGKYKFLMEAVLRGDVNIEEENAKSWTHIMENYTLSITNEIRANVLSQILGVTKEKLV